MELFAVLVNRDDTVRVASISVEKETPQFYILKSPAYDHPSHEVYGAYGYTSRVPKRRGHLSARAALEPYMKRRQQDKANAQAVIAQATKQIASANELLMHVDETK